MSDSAQGWASIPRWLLYTNEVSPTAKLVYVTIQSRVNDSAEAWPSHKRIAADSGLSVSSVQRALAELRELGVVEARERRRRDGGRASSVYRVSTARPQPVDNAPPSVTQTEGASVRQTEQNESQSL